MTRKEVREMLPIMQAYAEGKAVQFLNGDKWVDVYEIDFCESADKYRIKPEPEPKYRLFKSKKECWDEMMEHRPFGWLKSKNNGCFHCIGEVMRSEARRKVIIRFYTRETLSHSSDSIFNEYTFADGTPFGMKEE